MESHHEFRRAARRRPGARRMIAAALATLGAVASAAGAQEAAPQVSVAIGYTTMRGSRHVDATFVPSADAYVVVGHVGPDGIAQIVYPASPRDNGFVRGGYAYVVPTFFAGRTAAFDARRHTLTETRAAAAAVNGSYDGGAAYLFVIASREPLHTMRLAEPGGSRWAPYTLDAEDLEDPRPAVAELAATLAGAARPDGVGYSVTYGQLEDPSRLVASAPVAEDSMGATREPAAGAWTDARAYTPYPPPGDGTSASYMPIDGGYGYGLVDGYSFGYLNGFDAGFAERRFRHRCAGEDMLAFRSSQFLAPNMPAYGLAQFPLYGRTTSGATTALDGCGAHPLWMRPPRERPTAATASGVPARALPYPRMVAAPTIPAARPRSDTRLLPTVFPKAALGSAPVGYSQAGYTPGPRAGTPPPTIVHGSYGTASGRLPPPTPGHVVVAPGAQTTGRSAPPGGGASGGRPGGAAPARGFTPRILPGSEAPDPRSAGSRRPR